MRYVRIDGEVRLSPDVDFMSMALALEKVSGDLKKQCKALESEERRMMDMLAELEGGNE